MRRGGVPETLAAAGGDGGAEMSGLPEEIPLRYRSALADDGVSLSLANRRMTAIPDFVGSLTALTTLDLSGNQLPELPDCLANLTALTSLDLSDNQLRELPDWLGGLTALTTLDLGVNQLRELPDWLGGLTALTTLDLRHNELTVLPDCFGDFTVLTRLYLNVNQLTVLPESLGSLTALARLDVSHNQLTALPDSLGGLVSLTELYLGVNKLSVLPDRLGDLTGLARLDMADNQLTSVPECLRYLRALAIINVGRNQLAALPDFLDNFSILASFDASRNQLTDLPEYFGNLITLTSLNLGDNQLTELPESLGNLAALTSLEVWGNRLTDLPESLGRLASLTGLDLWGNELTEIPRSFGNLTALTTLDLSDNQLTELPDCLGNITALTSIDLSGNPLRSPLLEIAAEGTDAIKTYLVLVSADAVELWMSKLLVVGEGAVGKTSLVKALSGQDHNPDEPTTHGIQIAEIEFAHPHLPEVVMRLSSWDFGGQDIYHATHQFFLSDRSLFVLLWNARQGWEHAKLPYWLDIIKARVPHARVILVATHAYERPVDLPLSDLRAYYPQIVGSASVDNRTGKGIPDLRLKMAYEAAKLPLMGSRWPVAWATGVGEVIKSDLQHTTPEDLRYRLSAVGVSDWSHQTYLLRALHLLGEILYFDQDEELQDTIILRPQWVTGYIAKVLDSHEVTAKRGVLTRAHEQQLWYDLVPGLRDRLLLMMEKFDLSYRITDDATAASLVVECLPWESPAYEERWEGALRQSGSREIRMRYQLNILPPGIPTWFIAREHRFTTSTHWRSGALLSYAGDGQVLGLIRADRQEKTIELAVRGPVPQLFFSVLQDGFESTLDRYKGLEIIRMIPCNCANGDGTQPLQPCIHLYQYDPLIRRVRLGIAEVECELSFSKVSVTELLFGIAPATADQIASRLQSIDSQLSDFRNEVAWIHREFLKAHRQQQIRAEAECPSVFTLTPASGRIHVPNRQSLALRLYCEQPGAFHATPEPPYIIKQPTRWLVAIGPYLRTLVTILKHVAPLVGPVLGLTSQYLAQQLTYETSLMTALVSQLPEAHESGRLQAGGFREIEFDVDYRALRALLYELDPGNRWAELSRVYTPEGQILWLCRDHARLYS